MTICHVAGGELVSSLFARLSDGEFKLVPLSERFLKKEREDQDLNLAREIAAEAERKEKEERGVGGACCPSWPIIAHHYLSCL